MKFDAYEYISIATPGSILLFTLILLYPQIKETISSNGFDLGGLGIFLILSFSAGHVIQAAGNMLETLLVILQCDVSNRFLRDDQQLLEPIQKSRLSLMLTEKMHIDLNKLTSDEWKSIRSEMASHIRGNGGGERLNTFVRIYGLSRGLAIAFITSSILFYIFSNSHSFLISLLLFIASILSFLRMQRFSKHYLRELSLEYLRIMSVR